MDSLVRDLDEALLNDLECPVCTDYMAPPINLCCNGHSICNSCWNKVKCCPTCRGQFTPVRNVALENIARRQIYPCSNRDKGCSEVFPIDKIKDHQVICKYGPIRCPLNKFHTVKCLWKGSVSDFREHVKGCHENFYKSNPYIRSFNVGNGQAVRFLYNEAFLCFKTVENDKWYCVVQMVGTKEEASKYKSHFTLCGQNGIDKIVQTFVVRSFTEDFDDSFNTGKCLILDDKVMRNFIVNDELNLIITISKIEKEVSNSNE